jgi:hypothetical protein
MKQGFRRRGSILVLAVALACAAVGISVALAAQPVPGAIFTTDSTCSGVDLNIYGNKTDVYLDGGPGHPGAAGLPDGEYYVQVTGPEGTPLGTSVGAADETPVTVKEGEFESCYQLSAILIKASDSEPGYDDTPNPGGEYKVWVSTDSTFTNSQTKTDNFKVKNEGQCEPECGPPPQGTLNVEKFYDANANGVNDDGQPIAGWKFNIHDGINWDRETPISMILAEDEYVVTEGTPIQSNWFHTTENPVTVTLLNGDNKTVEFGNVCIGAGGGLTLGFWSNKNGQKLFEVGTDLALMVELNLRDGKGNNFDPKNYAAFRSWLLSATATNMAYMLSAQLAAMELNVLNGNVNGGSLIYAPGTLSANKFGFATVNAVMAEANTELGLHGLTLSGSPYRSYQEALKNALDKANNSLTFAQEKPCPFSFE